MKREYSWVKSSRILSVHFRSSSRCNSNESGISSSHLSIPDAEYADAESGGEHTPDGVQPAGLVPGGVEMEEEEFDAPLGTAKALYAFEGELLKGKVGFFF